MHTAVAKQKRVHPHRDSESESAHATRAPTPDCSSPILSLQRTLGNHAVGQFLQTKLAVSAPGDQYEQEADRVADQVMRVPEPTVQRKCAACGTGGGTCEKCNAEERPIVQRKVMALSNSMPPSGSEGSTTHLGSSASSNTAALISNLGMGQPLNPSTRAFFEPRFGYEFGHVRIHTGDQATREAQAIRAKAFTTGHHIAFLTGRYQPDTTAGKQLLAHELTHVIQQNSERPHGNSTDTISRAGQGIVQRDEFEPWPGQVGTDVPGTREQKGQLTRERVQRTGDPNYAGPQPALLEFDESSCMVTATMDVNFVHPSDVKARLSKEKFDSTKERFLRIANDKLNGWVTIEVENDKACTNCRGRMIRVKVVAREGTGQYSSRVELAAGSGRDNAGHIYASSSDSTFWHEAGHIIIGAPDEYPRQAGDPPRPADKINTSDWSIQSEHHSYGRRALMHSRHFSFISAWLKRRFPTCTFNIIELWKGFAVDVTLGGSISAVQVGGKWGLGYGVDLAAGLPLEKLRRWRLLLGGYADFIMQLEPPSRLAFLMGARIGIETSTNRSGGGFSVGADFRPGAAYAQGPSPPGASQWESGKYAWTPTVGGTLSLGYAGPELELGAQLGVHKFLGTEFKKDDPLFTVGLRAAWNF